MQEELENKTVTLMINGTKFSGRTLYRALTGFLRMTRHQLQKGASVKPQGRQSVKQLIGQNQGVSSLEFDKDSDLKSFERIAGKYGVDYAVKKVNSEKAQYMLFFKARDADAITAAFTEYTDNWKHRQKDERAHPSVLKQIDHFRQLLAGKKQDRAKDREISR